MALWLYTGLVERLPSRARDAIAASDVRLSPMAVLELAYLHEVGRARDPLTMMLSALSVDLGIEVADISMVDLVAAAADLSWTRDPFDRLIAAHAIVASAPLVTADETMRKHLSLALWD